jgi:hypothetical protein
VSETEKKGSEWTVGTLKEHYDQRFTAQNQAVNAALTAQKEAVAAALAASEKAVAVAEANAEKWRASANEWRGAMNDRERILMPRSEAEKSLAANAEKVDALATRIDRTEGRSGGLNAGWGYLVAAAGLVLVMITIFLALRRV